MAPRLDPSSEAQARTWLQRALQNVGLEITNETRSANATDLVVRTLVGDFEVELKSAGQGWPSNVQTHARAVEQIAEKVVLYARTFSTGAIDEMTRLGVNWVDFHGNVRFIRPPSLYIDRYRPVRRDDDAQGLHWSRSTEDIAEWALTHPDDTLSVERISTILGWSMAQTSRTLARFDDLGWTLRSGGLKGTGVARVLTHERGAMLESWSASVAASQPRIRRFHALTRQPFEMVRDRLVPHLNDARLDWALNGLAAAQSLTAGLTSVPSVDLTVSQSALTGPSIWRALDQAGFREVDEGAVLNLVELDSRVFQHRQSVDKVFVLSAPRVYASLMPLQGRGSEIAASIREELIGF